MVFVKGTRQTILEHGINNFRITHTAAPTETWQKRMEPDSCFLPTSYDNICIATSNRLSSQLHGLQTGTTNLVDSKAGVNSGSPAWTLIWRATFWPKPAPSAFPIITSSTCSGLTLAFPKLLITKAPKSTSWNNLQNSSKGAYWSSYCRNNHHVFHNCPRLYLLIMQYKSGLHWCKTTLKSYFMILSLLTNQLHHLHGDTKH